MAIKISQVKLAIIVPVLNNLEYTKDLLNSVKTKAKVRTFIINNASNDGTREFFKKAAKQGVCALIDNQENVGVAAAWNQGLECAVNYGPPDYFLIVNNDIILHPQAIDNLLNYAIKHDITLLSGVNIAAALAKPEQIYEFPLPEFESYKEAPEFSCFLLSFKKVLDVGGFDSNFWPAYFEDNDYHYRLRKKGLKAGSLSTALYFHYGSRTIREVPGASDKVSETYLKNKAYYEEKWGGEPGKERYNKEFDGNGPKER